MFFFVSEGWAEQVQRIHRRTYISGMSRWCPDLTTARILPVAWPNVFWDCGDHSERCSRSKV
jgi:hypothetical protein